MVLLLAMAGGAGALARSTPAGACSMAAMTVDFDGTVIAIDGPRVTYRLDRVRQDDPLGGTQLPEPGGTVVVHYDAAPHQLDVDHQYRVKGWDHPDHEVGSQIAYDFHGDCGTGAGTTALDGSYLVSAQSGRSHVWLYATAVFVVVGGAILALHTVVAHRQDQGSQR